MAYNLNGLQSQKTRDNGYIPEKTPASFPGGGCGYDYDQDLV